jgi:beta-1,4-N-acetylglucosaminyltransferase
MTHGAGRPRRVFVSFDAISKKKKKNILLITDRWRAGGHTAEMLALLRGFDLAAYSPRRYVVAATDSMSGPKAAAFEAERAAPPPPPPPPPPSPASPPSPAARRTPRKQLRRPPARRAPPPPPYDVVAIPRSREVGQSFRSSVPTTLCALRHALAAVLAFRPDLLLVNGPGTALPLVAAVLAARALGLARCRVVYVESIARVYRLSLTGAILYRLRLADEFLVQWEELAAAHPRAAFAGRLM